MKRAADLAAAAGDAPTVTRPPYDASPRRLAPETLRLYARDWAAFSMWCRSAGVLAAPVDPAHLAAHLSSLAETHSRGALTRRLAAVTYQHRQLGLQPPLIDPAARAILRASGRSTARRRKTLPSASQLPRMLATCPGDLAGLRDRALLLLSIGAGLSRAALVGLDAEVMRFTDIDVELTIEAEEDTRRVVIIARAIDPLRCPVFALQDWLRASDTRYGPVFRKIDRWGNVEHRRLGTDAIGLVLARRTPRRPRSTAAAAP